MSLPKKMKAAILVKQKKPLVIDEVELPSVLDVGQVLVRIHYSGICGSQLGEIDGAKGEDKFLPHLLGHEASGIVIDIGPGVKQVKQEKVGITRVVRTVNVGMRQRWKQEGEQSWYTICSSITRSTCGSC